MTFAEWKNAIRDAYSTINFHEFCRRLENEEDEYAEEKFRQFRQIAVGLAEFDPTTLERIVQPTQTLPPCECAGIRHTCRRFAPGTLVTVRED